jgi:hypothetical protein
MPLKLQIYTLMKIFCKANEHYGDPIAEMDNIDWLAYIQDDLNFQENLETFERNYPDYLWSIPKTQKEKKQMWHKEFDPKTNSYIYTMNTKIKPHETNSKSKTYKHGRIQVTVNKKWIGYKAKISVRIPKKSHH